MVRGIWSLAFALRILPGSASAQKIKVIVDQDAPGPATTDMQSILIFLESNQFDVLGNYGETLFWEQRTELPPYERMATIQFDVDAAKLYDLYIKLMTPPSRHAQ
jgi:hypothetical protein